MAFPDTPLGARVELGIGGVWTDVTADTYLRDPISIAHGIPNQASIADPSRCSLTFNNKLGKYSPRNPRSPYFGKIGRNTPLCVSVKGNESYLALDGTPTGTASTPDHASLAVTDLDARVETEIDWYGTDLNQTLLGQWGADGNRGWMLRITLGTLTLFWTTNGTVATQFFADFPLPALPRRAALRFTLDVNNGAGGYDVAAYWAPSLDGPWTLFGSATGTGGTAIFNSTSPLEIAPTQPGTVPLRAPFIGRGYRAEVRSGIGGPVVAAPDFRVVPAGTTSFTDATGKTWTLSGTAEISDREYRFVGDVSAWPNRWNTSGKDVWVPVEGAGVLRRLNQGTKALDSTLRRRIPSGNPLAYWPLEEGTNATRAPASAPGVAAAVVSGLDWATDDTLAGSAPLPKLKNPASLRAGIPPSAASGWQVECVYFLPTMPAAQTEILRVDVAGSVMRTAIVYASTSGIRIEARNADDAQIAAFVYTNPPAIADFTGIWNRLAIYTSDDGGGTTRLSAAWLDISNSGWWTAATTFTGAMGTATQVSGNWGANTEGMTIGHLSAFDTPGNGILPGVTIYESADDGFDGEQANARMLRLASEEAATVALSIVKGGDSTEALGPQRPAALLELLRAAAETDGGILAEALDKSALVYRDRQTLYNQTPALTLDYTAGGEVGPPLEPTEDDQRTRNDITVTRAGGSFGRAVQEEGPLSIKAPPLGVGVYDEQVTLSLHSDEQAEPIAWWRLHLATWDEARYPSVRLMLHKAPHLIPSFLKLRVGDRIQILNPPDWLPPGPIDLIVQGWNEVLGLYTWDVVLTCAPAGPWTVGVLDDPEQGRVDTEGSVTAAAVGAADTRIPIAAIDGPWTQDPADFPFGLIVGGEEVTATAITGVAQDAFGRTSSGTWGTADSGQAWTASGGAAADYTVSSGVGRHIANARSTVRATTIPVIVADVDLSVDVALSAIPAGDVASVWLMARRLDANNFYSARLQVAAGGAITLSLRKSVGGTDTQLATFATGLTLAAGTSYRVRLAVTGTSLSAKAWAATSAEPLAWQVTATDSALSGTGAVGVRTQLGAATTNPLPVTFSFDNLTSSPQLVTVTRAVNGVVKTHAAGTDVRLAQPAIVAL
ncbi:hypothetical protein ACF09L_32590 [Streptomyces sp. NPDC014779]|uniref:hypothetical protein n=1 Tax=Streptomyces sp. NPDC014779 TaxID=3364911 RepID=UPI00370297FC